MAVASKGKKRKIRFRFYIFVLCAVMLYAGYALISQWTEMRRLHAEQQTLQQQIDAAKLTMDKLNNLIEIADTDAYIESVAREKLGWVKPGETRYVIKDK